MLRLQPLPDVPGFSQHFRLFCLVSAGRGAGFESAALVEHAQAWLSLLRALGAPAARVRVTRPGSGDLEALAAAGVDAVEDDARTQGRGYYDGALFGVDAQDREGRWFTPADGGAVGWTRALLADDKERLFTSGFGVEFALRRLGRAAPT